MTAEEVQAFAHGFFDHLQARDAAVLAEDYAPDATADSPSLGTLQGRSAIEQGHRRWFSAFPDLVLTLEEVVAQDDIATLVFRATATHQDEFLGLPATGKRIEFRAVFLLKLRDHQIVYERRIYDFTGLLIRLGVLKVKPS